MNPGLFDLQSWFLSMPSLPYTEVFKRLESSGVFPLLTVPGQPQLNSLVQSPISPLLSPSRETPFSKQVLEEWGEGRPESCSELETRASFTT